MHILANVFIGYTMLLVFVYAILYICNMSNQDLERLIRELKKAGLNYAIFERNNNLTARCINVFLIKGILTTKNKELIIKGLSSMAEKINNFK